MNILFGKAQFNDWHKCFNELPYNIHIQDINNTDTLISYISANNINIIIPCTYTQMFFLIDNIEQILKHVKYICCSKDNQNIQLLDNKSKFNNYMITNSLGDYIPKVYIENNDGIYNTHNVFSYPCIFKTSIGCGGCGIKVINSYEDIPTNLSKNYFIQELIIDNIEYGGHFYVHNGIIKCYVFYMEIYNNKSFVKIGKMNKYKKIDNKEWHDLFGIIFSKLNYSGFACANFKVVNNIVKIFEINPRFGGTLIHDKDDFRQFIKCCINT